MVVLGIQEAVAYFPFIPLRLATFETVTAPHRQPSPIVLNLGKKLKCSYLFIAQSFSPELHKRLTAILFLYVYILMVMLTNMQWL